MTRAAHIDTRAEPKVPSDAHTNGGAPPPEASQPAAQVGGGRVGRQPPPAATAAGAKPRLDSPGDHASPTVAADSGAGSNDGNPGAAESREGTNKHVGDGDYSDCFHVSTPYLGRLRAYFAGSVVPKVDGGMLTPAGSQYLLMAGARCVGSCSPWHVARRWWLVGEAPRCRLGEAPWAHDCAAIVCGGPADDLGCSCRRQPAGHATQQAVMSVSYRVAWNAEWCSTPAWLPGGRQR